MVNFLFPPPLVLTAGVMRKRQQRARQLKSLLVFGLFLTLVLIFIVSTVGRREFNTFHKLGLEFVGLAQSGISRVIGAVSGVWDGYVDLWDVQEDNLRLREELQELKMDMAKSREAVATNIRLQKLLNLKKTLDAPFLTTRIIGRDPSQWFNTVIIDQGASEGILPGMPVVTAEGVVGQVRNVSPHYAKVLLANDSNSAIDALVQESRVQGIIKGNGKGYFFDYVLKNNEVKEGDVVVTSGMGGVFPKGLPVGTVGQVVRSKRGMFLQIEVVPAVIFSELEYLVVILQEKIQADEG